jgi:hypothetical protein
MQNINSMEPEENIESRLRGILQKPANLLISGSPEHLRVVSGQHFSDYKEVFYKLEKSRGRGLCTEYQWTEEYPELVGSTTRNLALLLLDEKYDAPWVFRPAYNKLFWAEPVLRCSAYFSAHHSPVAGILLTPVARKSHPSKSIAWIKIIFPNLLSNVLIENLTGLSPEFMRQPTCH